MFVTVHLADDGVRAIPRWRRSAPKARSTPGLRYSVVATPAPLGTGFPRPQLGRLGFIAFWDDPDAASNGLAGTPLGDDFDGLRLGLEPVRAVRSWTGLPEELPTTPAEVHDGPAFVITIARLRLLQAPRFFAASARAEKAIVQSPGLTWASGLAAPERRTLVTLSWWHDQSAMAGAARDDGDHERAIAKQAKKDFHHESAFIRFRPITSTGSLTGRNGLDTSALG